MAERGLPIEEYGSLRRLYERLRVRPAGASGLVSLSSEIVATVRLDEFIWTPVHLERLSDFTAAGVVEWNPLITVPAGQVARVFLFQAVKQAGDNEIDRMSVYDSSVPGQSTFITFTAAADYYHSMVQALLLDENDELRVHTTGAGVANTRWNAAAWVEMTDKF